MSTSKFVLEGWAGSIVLATPHKPQHLLLVQLLNAVELQAGQKGLSMRAGWLAKHCPGSSVLENLQARDLLLSQAGEKCCRPVQQIRHDDGLHELFTGLQT